MAREGEYSPQLIPVTGDVCGIIQRLKELDAGYFVMFNRGSGRFEVHHQGQGTDTLACELPYEQLDARAVQWVRVTAIDRAETLFRELLRQDQEMMEGKDEDV